MKKSSQIHWKSTLEAFLGSLRDPELGAVQTLFDFDAILAPPDSQKYPKLIQKSANDTQKSYKFKKVKYSQALSGKKKSMILT